MCAHSNGRTGRDAQLTPKSRLAATAGLDSFERAGNELMTLTRDSIARPAQRSHTAGDFAREEVGLANRNSGLPLEALRYDVTPAGMHFLLTHFDVPFVASAQDWRLEIGGRVRTPLSSFACRHPAVPGEDIARDARMRRQRPRQSGSALADPAMGIRRGRHRGVDRNAAAPSAGASRARAGARSTWRFSAAIADLTPDENTSLAAVLSPTLR